MDSKQLISYLEKPSNIHFEDIAGLQKYTIDYPFCQSVQILYSIYLSLKAKNENENYLQQAFLYTTNNIHLIDIKDILHSDMLRKDADTPKSTADLPKEIIKKGKATVEKDENKKRLQDILAKRLNTIHDKNNSDTTKDLKSIGKAEKKEAKEEVTEPPKKERPRIITKTDDQLKIKSQEEIIDKFIREEPSIGPISKNDSNIDIEFARKSTEPNNDIISETLANIHVLQGNNKRAIKLFEKLSLKYPEKSSYFAAQIQNLKKKVKK